MRTEEFGKEGALGRVHGRMTQRERQQERQSLETGRPRVEHSKRRIGEQGRHYSAPQIYRPPANTVRQGAVEWDSGKFHGSRENKRAENDAGIHMNVLRGVDQYKDGIQI